MLDLCAPRTLARNAQRLKREHGIDSRVVARSRKVLTDALRGGSLLSRPELYRRLEGARIATGAGRGLHLLWWHAHEGLICLGPRAGKQQTFVLMDEWLPATPPRSREESLAELARRYFASHGPATVRDFAWWSGLAAADAALALEMVDEGVARRNGRRPDLLARSRCSDNASSTRLLICCPRMTSTPWRIRIAAPSCRARLRRAQIPDTASFYPAVVIDGQIAGTWSRKAAEGIRRDHLPAFRAGRSPADAGARGGGAALREVPRPEEAAGSSFAASRRSQSMNAAAAGVGRRCAGCTT